MPFPIRTAPRAEAVPPGRVGYDITAPVLLLHTVQTAEALEELVSTGRLVPDPALAYGEYTRAYAWMTRQMGQRLPTAGPGALWLWAKIPRAGLIDHCHGYDGQVLLTCRVPRERVLLSHYGDWHSVLNASLCYRDLPGEDVAAADARIDALQDDFYARVDAAGLDPYDLDPWPAELRAELEATWEINFDPSWYGRAAHWQATVHELRAEDVVEAVRFAD
ncbi:DUF3841 domain-containing protein [Sinomonas atrocyanea]